MASSAKPPKAMSSRLSTMKFMQRAAATPARKDQPPTKKLRLSEGSSGALPKPSPRSDSNPAPAVLTAEERRRAEAVEKEGADRGETKWHLSFSTPQTVQTESPMRIVSAGYSTIDLDGQIEADSEDDEGSEEVPQDKSEGRKNFGNFKKLTVKEQTADESLSSASGSEDSGGEEEDGEIGDDPTGMKTLIAQGRRDAAERVRAERKARKRADAAKSNQYAEERRKKEVKLNRISSISAGGGRRPADSSPRYESQKRARPRQSY